MFTSSDMMLNAQMSQNHTTMELRRKAAALFETERRHAYVERILAWLTHRSNHLKMLCQAIREHRFNGHYMGARTVALEEILGSESRSDDFDRSFHPLSSKSLSRWVSIAVARETGETLPPVELIKVGEAYYVRDGHHRLSVAHAFGEHYIEAIVTEW